MHIHILGICGTFMGGLALIARSAGHRVTGCDANVYPPMSTQLQEQGIELIEGFDPTQLSLKPDLYIVGNVVSRGNPLMEAILDQRLPYTSGPQWLGEHILRQRHVLAVAGTHGKTTTTSMLTWILQQAGLAPSFLIGGIAQDLGVSAHLNTNSQYFVIEADEYDTAFFDKRSKFLHYHAQTLILNNLEYDHADIFPDLASIQTQFHHVVRTIAQSGCIIYPPDDSALTDVIAKGCYSQTSTIGEKGQWHGVLKNPDASLFEVFYDNKSVGLVSWKMQGKHNMHNALAAIAGANHIGIDPHQSILYLNQFSGIKRRMELKGVVNQISVYDDFAHHPTAIATTLEGLRQKVGKQRIIAVIDPHSNTMKLGVMAERLPSALAQADYIFCFHETKGKHSLQWQPKTIFSEMGSKFSEQTDIAQLVHEVSLKAQPGDHILVMSNGGFGGFHQKLLDALAKKPL